MSDWITSRSHRQAPARWASLERHDAGEEHHLAHRLERPRQVDRFVDLLHRRGPAARLIVRARAPPAGRVSPSRADRRSRALWATSAHSDTSFISSRRRTVDATRATSGSRGRLQIRRCGHRDIRCGNPKNRSAQCPEEGLCRPRHDLATEPAREVGLVDHGGAAGLGDRRDTVSMSSGLSQRRSTTSTSRPSRGEVLGRREAQRHAGRPRHEGGVGPRASAPERRRSAGPVHPRATSPTVG